MFRTANLRQFLIDSESTSVSEHELAYFENQAVWERVLVYRFLDTKNTLLYCPGEEAECVLTSTYDNMDERNLQHCYIKI